MQRKEAKAQGLPRYFTGNPCKRGHISERLTYNGQCIACKKEWYDDNPEKIAAHQKKYKKANREKIAAQKKEWYDDNKEKILAYRKEYYDDNKEQLLAQMQEYYADNKEQILAYQKEYYEDNRDKLLAQQKKYYEDNKEQISAQQKEYYEENREKITAYIKEWQKSNPESRRSYNHKRRAKTKEGEPASVIAAWVKAQPKICYLCHKTCKENYHIDHYLPLSKGGLHTINNLRISCPKCNLSKSAKDPYEFAKSIGKLF